MSGIRSLLRTSLLIGIVGAVIACEQQAGTLASEAVPYYNTPDFTPVWLTDPMEIDQKITHQIADFSFRDQKNELISPKSVAGKVYVANFFFTSCPTVCPKMTSLLKVVQDTFLTNPNVALLSFSVTPWIDSVARLQRYATQKGVIASKWHLLTGDRGQLYDLARTSYFAEDAIGFTRDSTDFLHTEHLILVDQHRRIRGVYNGTQPLEIDKLILDIKALLPTD